MSRPFASSRLKESATLIRQEPGHDNQYGEWVEGAEVSTDITVVSTPPDAAKMRDLMPEGTRLTASRTFWIEGVEIKLAATGPNLTEADVIEYKDKRYRAHHLEQWPGFAEVLGIQEQGQ